MPLKTIVPSLTLQVVFAFASACACFSASCGAVSFARAIGFVHQALPAAQVLAVEQRDEPLVLRHRPEVGADVLLVVVALGAVEHLQHLLQRGADGGAGEAVARARRRQRDADDRGGRVALQFGVIEIRRRHQEALERLDSPERSEQLAPLAHRRVERQRLPEPEHLLLVGHRRRGHLPEEAGERLVAEVRVRVDGEEAIGGLGAAPLREGAERAVLQRGVAALEQAHQRGERVLAAHLGEHVDEAVGMRGGLHRRQHRLRARLRRRELRGRCHHRALHVGDVGRVIAGRGLSVGRLAVEHQEQCRQVIGPDDARQGLEGRRADLRVARRT